jgi:hypothetical protein
VERVTAPEAREWLVNNGWLEDLAVGISVGEGLQETPEFREVNVSPPGMHGELDIGSDPTAPRRPAGTGQITWTGWVKGVDPATGAWTEGSSLDRYFRRVDALVRMFAPRQLIVDHVRPDGIRRAVGYRVGKIAPVRERTSPVFGKFSATVRIPGAFWSDTADVTISRTLATGGVLPLGPLAVGNAPIQDAVVTFGPGSNPTLIQGGTYLAYDGVIASGREVAVETDPADPGVGPGAGALWTPEDTSIRYGPNPTWFEIDPTAGDLVLQHTGGGQMPVKVTARPRWQTS